MSVAIVTGSGGLVGSETVRLFHDRGFDVVGIDNDMRAQYFGPMASTAWRTEELSQELSRFMPLDLDVRDRQALGDLFERYGRSIAVIVHCAAQPSHDWAAGDPETDFAVNALATLNLLELTRRTSPDAVFIHMSTNKVYGDLPNALPLVEAPTRWQLSPDHEYAEFGIPETMSIDHSTHSLFGVSKAAADLLAQEYGRYFGLRTGVFRGGCLTGPAHSGAPLHGFLSYLVQCGVGGVPYNIIGHKGKQVRDNIHSADLVAAFWEFFQYPKLGEVYNMGGSSKANVSILEAITLIEEISGREMEITYTETPRRGDHIWYVSDVRKFERDFPDWSIRHSITETIVEMVEHARERSGRGGQE